MRIFAKYAIAYAIACSHITGIPRNWRKIVYGWCTKYETHAINKQTALSNWQPNGVKCQEFVPLWG